MTFVDVGAHFGYFTLLAAQLVGRSGQVHSFEPTPSTCATLRHNTTGLAQVRVNQSAVWVEPAPLALQDFGARLSMFNSLRAPRLGGEQLRAARTTQVVVDAVSLDDYVVQMAISPDFVKVDAESTEMQVLEGMTHTMAQHRPTISIEVGDLATGAPASRTLLEYGVDHYYAPTSQRRRSQAPHVDECVRLRQHPFDAALGVASALPARVTPSDPERPAPLKSCMSSSRRVGVYRLVSYGMVVDFEDAVASPSTAGLVPFPPHSRPAQLSAALRGRPMHRVTAPGSSYDVCLLVAMAPYRVPSLAYIRDHRRTGPLPGRALTVR